MELLQNVFLLGTSTLVFVISGVLKTFMECQVDVRVFEAGYYVLSKEEVITHLTNEGEMIISECRDLL